MVTSEKRNGPRKAALANPAPAKGPPGRKAPVKRKTPARSTSSKVKPAPAARSTKSKPTRSRRKPAREIDVAAQLHGAVVHALDDIKARDVQEIDVRDKSSFTDLLIVASGTSTRHVKSIADEVVKSAKQIGQPPLGVEGQREAEWVLVDLGDIVVHIMLPRTREFYGLERLWTVGDDPAPAGIAL